jgi:hypothetical protein
MSVIAYCRWIGLQGPRAEGSLIFHESGTALKMAAGGAAYTMNVISATVME